MALLSCGVSDILFGYMGIKLMDMPFLSHEPRHSSCHVMSCQVAWDAVNTSRRAGQDVGMQTGRQHKKHIQNLVNKPFVRMGSEDHIKVYLMEITFEDVKGMELAQDHDQQQTLISEVLNFKSLSSVISRVTSYKINFQKD